MLAADDSEPPLRASSSGTGHAFSRPSSMGRPLLTVVRVTGSNERPRTPSRARRPAHGRAARRLTKEDSGECRGMADRLMASWMACVGFVGLKTATPSATAARTTASASIADDARRSRTTGSSGAPGCDASACSAMAAAAARSMWGVTLEAPETITPRPRPGPTRNEPACRTVKAAPSCPATPAALPVATSARPSDQAMTSDGAALAVDAGPETGRISGRPAARHMASMTGRVNAPSTAEMPSRIVGAASSMASVSPTDAGVPTSQI